MISLSLSLTVVSSIKVKSTTAAMTFRPHVKSVKTVRHENLLIVAAADYSSTPAHAEASHLQRPKHALTNPSDPLIGIRHLQL